MRRSEAERVYRDDLVSFRVASADASEAVRTAGFDAVRADRIHLIAGRTAGVVAVADRHPELAAQVMDAWQFATDTEYRERAFRQLRRWFTGLLVVLAVGIFAFALFPNLRGAVIAAAFVMWLLWGVLAAIAERSAPRSVGEQRSPVRKR